MAFDLKHHEEISARITEVYTSIEKLTQLLCYEPNIDEEVSDPLSDARIAISEAAVALQKERNETH